MNTIVCRPIVFNPPRSQAWQVTCVSRSDVGCGSFDKSKESSQEELAARANLHRNYVGSVERGERDVGIAVIGRLASAAGVSLAEFFATFRHRSKS
jgi:hypothetical protein